MNKNNEILKLERDLKVPVSDIRFTEGSVSIICGQVNIGAIAFYEMGGILHYDCTEGSVNRLNWSAIYLQHKNLIDAQIVGISGTSEIVILLGLWRQLYIRDEEGALLFMVECIYTEGVWSVHRL